MKATTAKFSETPNSLFALGEILTLLFYGRTDPLPYELVARSTARILAVPHHEADRHLRRLIDNGLVLLTDGAETGTLLSLNNRATLVDEIKRL